MTTASIRNAASETGSITAAFFVRNVLILTVLAILALMALART